MSDKRRLDPDGTEMIDLGDADVSAVELESQRSLPPPLPPEVRASAPPVMAELAARPSNAPPAAYASIAPPPPRTGRFYVLLLAAFLAVGIVAGIAVAMGTRGEKKPEAKPGAAAAPSGSVMTLPIIDMNQDDPDGGN